MKPNGNHDRDGGPAPDGPRLGPVDFVLLGILVGLVTGAAEVSSHFLGWYLLGRSFYSLGGISIVWTIPVADMVVYGLLGSLIALAMTRWRGDRFARGALIGLVAVGTYGLLPHDLRLHWIAKVLLSLGAGVQLGGLLSRDRRGLRRFVRVVTLPVICLV